MKFLFYVACFISFGCAAIATPVSIVYGIYLWAGADIIFKVALWSACKLWLVMLVGGVVVGVISYFEAECTK